MDYQHKLAETKNKKFSKFANGDELFQVPKAINPFCNMWEQIQLLSHASINPT